MHDRFSTMHHCDRNLHSRRTVLGSNVVALLVQCGGVHTVPQDSQEVLITHYRNCNRNIRPQRLAKRFQKSDYSATHLRLHQTQFSLPPYGQLFPHKLHDMSDNTVTTSACSIPPPRQRQARADSRTKFANRTGFSLCPPVYPTCVASTPGTLWKASSTPQKHPAAKVASCGLDAGESADLCSTREAACPNGFPAEFPIIAE